MGVVVELSEAVDKFQKYSIGNSHWILIKNLHLVAFEKYHEEGCSIVL